MPKINVYLPDELAAAVRDACVPVSAICQAALERAVRDVASLRGAEADAAAPGRAPTSGPFARFTTRARHALELAEEAARAAAHDHVATEHLLLGVIDEGANLAVKVLELLDVEPADVRAELVASMAPAASAPIGKIPFAALAKEALDHSATEAIGLGHNYVGCEHLLLGLLATEGAIASQVLRRMGVELRTTRRAVSGALVGFLHAQQGRPAPRTDTTAALDEIGRRLDAIEQRVRG